jgi:hypothetical protein
MHDPDEPYTVAQLQADLELIERARSLYPHSDYLQQEWLRAVTVVRESSGGWLIEVRSPRLTDAQGAQQGANA